MVEIIVAAVVIVVALVALVGFVVLPRTRRPPAAPPRPDEVDEQAQDLLEQREPRVTPPLPEAAEEEVAGPLEVDVEEETAAVREEVEAPPAPLTPTERFVTRLTRARNSLGNRIAEIFGHGLSEEAWEDLEDSLIAADVGMEATLELVEGLRNRCREEDVRTGEEALALLKEILSLELSVADRRLARKADGTTVWLVTGVNGSGKTTSIGKIAARHVRDGSTVVLAAADTFRAAAAEQLQLWGERAGARVVRHGEGADPAAVAFDGWKAAEQAEADLLLVDTAGRLQNKRELMDELSKTKRVLERGAGPCDEVLLVLDATTGQNGLSQAKAFTDAVDVTGVVLTKLDGTAKGGIVIAIQRQLGLPVKLVGLGEDIDDLAEFDPDAFVEALFAQVTQEVEELPADDGDEGAADVGHVSGSRAAGGSGAGSGS
jgi:fused signal recognition particle receptor